MTTARFEAVLARLYVDDAFRRSFLADPAGEAARAGLDPDEARALAEVDAVDLEMAARSFAHKRARAPRRRGWLARLLGR
ncbi:MAG: hypothetical protein DMD86_14145 [Candidatus Rokuibacteriota bacterium]|nr:MAG: hypothetical protein DMD86_14145 [Candidatus Rokubacteria bacterium]